MYEPQSNYNDLVQTDTYLKPFDINESEIHERVEINSQATHPSLWQFEKKLGCDNQGNKHSRELKNDSRLRRRPERKQIKTPQRKRSPTDNSNKTLNRIKGYSMLTFDEESHKIDYKSSESINAIEFK